MPWLERTEGETTHVRVVEARGTVVWERRASGRKPGRGRVHELGEHPSNAAAASAAAARVAALELEGYALVDPDAGVDALRPRGRSAPPLDSRLRADDLRRELRRALAALPDAPTPSQLLAAFDGVVTRPHAYRARGFHLDRTVAESVTLTIILPSSEGCWREVGYDATLAPFEDDEDEDLTCEDVRGDDESWDHFRAALLELDAWTEIADRPCAAVEIRDEDID